jgi:hypothetical protein
VLYSASRPAFRFTSMRSWMLAGRVKILTGKAWAARLRAFAPRGVSAACA